MNIKLTSLQVYHIALVVGMLITGCINTLSKKFQNDTKAQGWNGDVHYFQHPWFQTLIMFCGEFMCLVGLSIQRHRQRVMYYKEHETAMKTERKDNVFQLILIVPTLLDLLGTSFGGIGLVYVTASVWQMLRGSIIIFTGILSRIFLKRVLLPYRWVAMCVTIAGLVLVGVSGLLSDTFSGGSVSSSTSSSADSGISYMMLFGMLCILLGQLVGAIQMFIPTCHTSQLLV